MDVTDKIIKFSSLDALKAAIIKDLSSRDVLAKRYGVRFIMLNNFDTYQKLANYLQDEEVELVGLESILPIDDPDGWITTDMLKNRIFQCTKPSLIAPFSELVRFYPEDQFRGFFSEIILSEKSKGKRIYIPIIGLQNRFTDFLSHFGRLQESAPIWQFDDEPQSVEVFVVTKYKDIKLPSSSKRCHLATLREWLRFWKDQAPQEKIICSSLPITVNSKHAKPDNIFKFTPITDACQYIERFLDVTVPIPWDPEESTFWDDLLLGIIRFGVSNFDFSQYIHSLFNKAHMGVPDCFSEWAELKHSAYERWLLKKYMESSSELKDYPYLKLCLDECKDYDNPYKLYVSYNERLFYCTPIEVNAYIDERSKMMGRFSNNFNRLVPSSSQEWVFNHIKEVAKESTEDAVRLCTGTFQFEKPFLLGAYAQHRSSQAIFNKIIQVYPDAVRYLSDVPPTVLPEKQMWAYNYVKDYKVAKLCDEYTPEIEKAITTMNESSKTFYQWYFTFKNTKDRFAELQKDPRLKPDKVYWFDGLGLEYLGLIDKLLESMDPDLRIVKSEITRSNLPSSTSLNGFYGPDIIKKDGIDRLGHDSDGYKQYSTLVREIDLIRAYIQEIVDDNQGRLATIVIVSDHGMSCLSRKVESRKLKGKYDHEGRYIKSDEEKIGDDDFFFEHPNETDGIKYRIALRHTSLAHKPTHEVHGGATPEEVLVPFIVISNKENAKPVEYQIKLWEEKVALSDKTVSMTIMPQPESVVIRSKDQEYEMERKGTKWSAKIENAVEGVNELMIVPLGGFIQNVKVEFFGLGGSGINDMFDL